MTSGTTTASKEQTIAASKPPTPTVTLTTLESENEFDVQEANEQEPDVEQRQDPFAKNQQLKHQRPDEYIEGLWDAEPFYYCVNGPTTAKGLQHFYAAIEPLDSTINERRQKRGVIYKRRENNGSANEYECFQSQEGTIYRAGDQIFVESSREEPWIIGSIVSFKMKKRDQLLVKLVRYYRPNDVPELSFSLITQERIQDGHFHHMTAQPHHARELFSSESTLLFHASALRGKCSVKLVKDLRAALAEIDLNDPDSFFNCLNYNQESGRLASVQMSIRVGSAHQADIPSCSNSSLSDEPDRDELLYRPGYLCSETEQQYVKMARTFRTFTLMNNKRITMLEKSARTGDLLLDDAVSTLHRSGYNIVESINTMQAIDKHLTTDSSFMSADDVKKFGKGIKQYGKNFNKINKELLPHHRREQLVAFYYLWKKSRDATRPKPLGNAKRTQVVASVGRRAKNGSNGSNGQAIGIANGVSNGGTQAENSNNGTGHMLVSSSSGETEIQPGIELSNDKVPLSGPENSVPAPDDLLDYGSASETETEQLEMQAGGSGRACHHCFTSKSKDWHHTGRDRLLLMCTECHLFYKKYGHLRPVDRPSTVPPCLLASGRQESNEEEDENEEPANQVAGSRVRTRGALTGRHHRPRRTPSSLETEQRLRGTPQKLSAEEEQLQQRRTTPVRNSATKSGSGRKRGHHRASEAAADESTSTPPKVKRQRKNASGSPPSTVCSRTPSPSQQQMPMQMAGEGTAIEISSAKKTPKREKHGKEKTKEGAAAGDDDRAMKESSTLLQKVTAPAAEGTATPTPKHAAPYSPEPSNSSTTTSTNSTTNSTTNSPRQPFAEGNLSSVDLATAAGIVKKRESIDEQFVRERMPTAPSLLISKKPIAKVEPLDNSKKVVEASVGSTRVEEQSPPKEDHPTIICVDLSEEDGDEPVVEETERQDHGPLADLDSTEMYRTQEGKKDAHTNELIPLERRTILERRLRRPTGLTCARTDIIFVEPQERRRYNQLKKEQERMKREQHVKVATANSSTHQQQQQQTVGGGGTKKLEMTPEFGSSSRLPSSGNSANPFPALLMNNCLLPATAAGSGIPSSFGVHQPHYNSQQSTAAAAQSSQHNQQHVPESLVPTAAQLASLTGQHLSATQHHHPLLGQSSMTNPIFQHQQEQALGMQMQMLLQQHPMFSGATTMSPNAPTISAAGQQQQQLLMQMAFGLHQQQEQRHLLEQFQRQQQQQAAQQRHNQQQRPQTASLHLNNQQAPPQSTPAHHNNAMFQQHHQQQPQQFVNGVATHNDNGLSHAMGHKMSSGNAPSAANVAALHSQQQKEMAMTQQQQQQNATAASIAATMGQMFNFGGPFLGQNQQRGQQPHQLSAIPGNSANHPMLMSQQQQQQGGGGHQSQQQSHQQQAALAEFASLMGIHNPLQPQQQTSNQQQQNLQQQLMSMLGMPAQEHRGLEEQINRAVMSQQMAAAAQQQQQQQQQSHQAQQQQHQNLMAALATVSGGGMPVGAEQMAQMAQQLSFQQQQQQQHGHLLQPSPSATSMNPHHQQFQQQLLQAMSLQQQQNAQQQQQQGQPLLQQLESLRRTFSQQQQSMLNQTPENRR